uniref:Uncharacterized protein n=1 Tax=Arundo donax TaxID=35708 RepID=A0A0A9C1V5_ARUDO
MRTERYDMGSPHSRDCGSSTVELLLIH